VETKTGAGVLIPVGFAKTRGERTETRKGISGEGRPETRKVAQGEAHTTEKDRDSARVCKEKDTARQGKGRDGVSNGVRKEMDTPRKGREG
jgi:hypothetical protein